jgi:SAM-dependent methyltransferase
MSSELYTEDYYAENCGGAEFFKLYGPKVLKPALALAYKRLELRPGVRLLDVGCGRGELLYKAKEAGAEAVGCDYAEAAVALAQKTSGCRVERCDAKKLPFPSGSFDRISFLGVIDHLTDQELSDCFAEFRRVLAPGGFVVVNTCVNTDYYKMRSYALRKRLASLLGLKEPTAQRAAHDEHMHVNEHGRDNLRELFQALGWRGELEPRENPKLALDELYEGGTPNDFPLKRPSPLKLLAHKAVFWGPWKRFLAREWFCKIRPVAGENK